MLSITTFAELHSSVGCKSSVLAQVIKVQIKLDSCGESVKLKWKRLPCHGNIRIAGVRPGV